MPSSAFLQDLAWRGQVAQATDLEGLDKHLSTGPAQARKAYVGFDPTADSLTIGNLVGIMALARFQQAGHTPVAIMGGGTGLIGDPSGKSAERQLRTKDEIASNVASIQTIFERVWGNSGVRGSSRPTIINNIDWLGSISYLDALRDIGKYFSVNMMMQKDSVKERLTNRDQGISYTEFSYMILQAYDYQQLHEKHGVTLQMGGSDQFGNIVVGMDLITKKANEYAGDGQNAGTGSHAFGLTWPLVTKADGTKFGKTESGAIWLSAKHDANDTSPARTSAYAYYQFWLNAADADVVRLLKTYTFLPQEEVTSLEQQVLTTPAAREAQRRLAQDATRILHGDTAMQQAEAAGKALFSGDIAHLSRDLLEEVFASVPASTHAKASLEGAGVGLLDLLVTTQLAGSKREAKEFLASGSVSINGQKASAEDALRPTDLLHGEVIAIKRGKKAWHVTRWK